MEIASEKEMKSLVRRKKTRILLNKVTVCTVEKVNVLRVICCYSNQIKTFVKRRMSQANQRRIVAETMQSVCSRSL